VAVIFRSDGWAPQGTEESTEAIAFNFRNEKAGTGLGEGNPFHPVPRGQQTRRINRGAVILGSSDLVPFEPLYPTAHSFSWCCFEIKDDGSIFIEVKDGEVFFRIDNDGILP